MVSGCWNWFHGNILLTTVFDVLFAFVDKFWKKRKNKKYHTVRTVPKSINRKTKNTTLSEHFLKSINRKIIETETKWIPLTHIYTWPLTFRGWYSRLQIQTSFMAQWGNDVPCKRFPQNWSKYHKSKSQQIMQWPKEKKKKYKQWSTKQ